jgi:hypothetical protein
MLILGIAGKAGSGKDTVCDYLAAKHGFAKVSLATPLKVLIHRVFPKIPADNLYGPSHLRNAPVEDYPLSGLCPSCGVIMRHDENADLLDRFSCGACLAKWPEHLSARVALQTLGTDWGRRLYPDVWVDYLFAHLTPSETPLLCISDVRFPNEVRAVLRNGGRVAKVTRPTGELPASGHASETSLDGFGDGLFDTVLRNEGSKDDLYVLVDEMLRRIDAEPSV